MHVPRTARGSMFSKHTPQQVDLTTDKLASHKRTHLRRVFTPSAGRGLLLKEPERLLHLRDSCLQLQRLLLRTAQLRLQTNRTF